MTDMSPAAGEKLVPVIVSRVPPRAEPPREESVAEVGVVIAVIVLEVLKVIRDVDILP